MAKAVIFHPKQSDGIKQEIASSQITLLAMTDK